MLNLLFFVLHPVAMGYLAQTKYGKTGALWGFLALMLDAVIGFLTDATMSGPEFLKQNVGANPLALELTFLLLTFGISTGIIWGILATLPKRNAP